ncbi:hypothetical protein BKA62DRAFT_692995 [Auriculariales sp. MPI-PUGE-AT-0066]|nr:hypothetical protein BKA62DRAFT_692995 [Auriculariales sp. MPI-PUGE-AT-0066]
MDIIDAETNPLLPPDPAVIEPQEPQQVHEPVSEPKPEPAPDVADTDHGHPEADPDAPTCRICLAGREEEAESGRLIRPCLCRGTVAYVHVQCLNSWRKTAPGAKHFWECAQCGYKYQLVRTRALGLANSRFAVGLSTMTLFTLLVFSTSLIFSLFLPSAWIDGSSTTVAKLVKDGTVAQDDAFYSWSYSSEFTNNFWKEAYSVMNELIDFYVPSAATEPPSSDTESTSYRYKRDEAASRKPDAQGQPQRKDRVSDRATRDSVRTGPFKSTVSVDQQSNTRERKTQLRPSEGDGNWARERKPSFLVRLLRRFFLGLAIVGAVSFATIGWVYTIPANWFRRRGRRAEGDDKTIYTIMIVVLLVVGIGRALWYSYKATTVLTTALLRRAETAILEVGSNEPIPLEDAEEPPLLAMLTRQNLRRTITRQFWVDRWWDLARFGRGVMEVVREALAQIPARQIVGIVLALLALWGGGAFQGNGGFAWGGGGLHVWEFRF